MTNKMIRAGIVGVSGYSGAETLELLLKHPQVRVTYVAAHNTTGKIAEIWPKLANRTTLVCQKYNFTKAVKNCDIIFLAVPHTTAMAIVPHLLKAGVMVIDLSGDYRLKSAALYQKWYQASHTDKYNLRKAVYGLPELYRTAIQKAKFVSNPGCYPTSAILGLAPIVSTQTKAVQSIIVDAKSGVSGAGKKLSPGLLFNNAHENFMAYKVLAHQHNPEIELYVSRLAEKDMPVTFVTHLLPIFRGILSTIYVQLKTPMTLLKIHTLYQKFYKTEPFVRIMPLRQQPEIKNVSGTNYCDIGLAYDKDKGMLVITSAIDNLVKGAAGQAVQNMNLMCGFNETTALK